MNDPYIIVSDRNGRISATLDPLWFDDLEDQKARIEDELPEPDEQSGWAQDEDRNR
jgi:hypothetical protein